jgi:putative membrane protein
MEVRMRNALAVLAATALALVAAPAFAQGGGYGYDGWSGHMWGWSMMGGGFVMMVLVFVLIVAVIALVWRAVAGPAPHVPPRHDPALTALRERFARGEIDEAEYQARKRVLEG